MWDGLLMTLQGSGVRLEPLTRQHAAGLRVAAGDGELFRWWPMNPASSDEAFAAWMATSLEDNREGRRAVFATIDAAAGTPVGSTSYLNLAPADRRVEIGWTWLSTAVWGNGINVEAKRLMLGHAFDTLGCHCVQFRTDAMNERSRRAILALGASSEGTNRDDRLRDDGTWRSSAEYSILESEWPAVRKRLDARLADHVA